MSSWSLSLPLALTSLVAALPASADVVSFNLDRVSTNGPDLRPQITLTAEAMPDNSVMFHVNNLAGGAASSICEITFDDNGATRGLTGPLFQTDGPGMVFCATSVHSPSPAPAVPALTTNMGFITTSNAAVSATGVTPGTGMDIRMKLLNGETFDDIVAKMQRGEIVVGLRVDTPNTTDHFVSAGGAQVIPIPSGALLGGTGLTGVIFAGWLRKRRLT